MEYPVIVILIIIMIFLLKFSSVQGVKSDKAVPKTDIFSNFCPLCGTGLKKGEKVKSVVYPAGNSKDGRYPGGTEKMMEVYGCPNCIPPEGKEDRICPVCQKIIPRNGFVVGRYFIPDNRSQEKQKKNHLHVLGCTQCRRV